MDMRDKKRAKEHYTQLAQKYGIQERYQNTLTQVQDILEGLGILEKVNVDTRLLGVAILNYFEDIDRLKEFEGIERANVEKIYAYEAFWFLRAKPIQLLDNSVEMKYLHINEKVCTAILISKMCKEMERGYDTQNDRILSFLDLLYYNFKYRLYTQQSLEVMISAFFCGCSFK